MTDGDSSHNPDNTREFRLYRMTWPEVEQALPMAAATLIPVGSMEQHGHHMPLDNDTFTSLACCERVAAEAQRRGKLALVTQPINYGVSWYHMDFPGTIHLDVRTFIDVVMQLCGCLMKHGFRNLILFNSHGGNTDALNVAINQLYEHRKERVYVARWSELAPEAVATVGGPRIHSDAAETSLALALGQRVEMDRARRDAFSRRETVAALEQPTSSYVKYDAAHKGPGIGLPMDYIRDISKTGVVGDPTGANLALGEQIISAVVDRLAAAIVELDSSGR